MTSFFSQTGITNSISGSAQTSANNAATSETNAAASAAAALVSQNAAATSASNAATDAASTALDVVSTAADAVSTAADAVATAADRVQTGLDRTAAANSATTAQTHKNDAENAKNAAETAEANAEAAYDDFDDRYLGAKSTSGGEPTVDNDGDALAVGALFFDTTNNVMKVYSGSAWLAAYASAGGALQDVNNLSDLSSASTARTNLGLGTAATTASTDYATAAQGALAASAVQPSDNVSTLTNDSNFVASGDNISVLTNDSGFTTFTADQAVDTTSSPTFAAITVTGNVDGRDVSADGTKLDGIESGATADQTASEIKTAYESNADTNAFTDALQTKLNGIETAADVTDATNVASAGAFMATGGSISGNTDITGNFEVSGSIISGDGSGGVALTTNDGGGDANLTFNHVSQTPDQNGNSFRITCNTDSTSNGEMKFEIAENVTSGAASTSTTTYLEVNTSGIDVTGAVVASGDVTAFSDQRLKTDVKTIDDALVKVCRMRGVSFIKDGSIGSGVIAQELEQVAPELVRDGEYKSVAYGNLVGYLIEAVKTLSDKVEELENGSSK